MTEKDITNEMYDKNSKLGNYKLAVVGGKTYRAKISVTNDKKESKAIPVTFTVPVNPMGARSTGTIVGVMVAIIISTSRRQL